MKNTITQEYINSILEFLFYKWYTFWKGQAYIEVWDKRKSLFSYSLKTPYHEKSTFKCSF